MRDPATLLAATPDGGQQEFTGAGGIATAPQSVLAGMLLSTDNAE
jgi:hypothetical protein